MRFSMVLTAFATREEGRYEFDEEVDQTIEHSYLLSPGLATGAAEAPPSMSSTK